MVQDAFLTETARLADVVLPAAIWGEKTGTFTNADRTVHLSRQAVDPPGGARSDLDILLDFARRIAKLPTMTALLIKESVNQTQDNQGFHNSLNACFTMHELNHSHWAQVHENRYPVALEEDGIPSWKDAPPIVPAEKGTVRADA